MSMNEVRNIGNFDFFLLTLNVQSWFSTYASKHVQSCRIVTAPDIICVKSDHNKTIYEPALSRLVSVTNCTWSLRLALNFVCKLTDGLQKFRQFTTAGRPLILIQQTMQ